MNQAAYVSFFRELATASKAIRHHQPHSLTDARPRKAFFRSEQEYVNALHAGIHYPCMILHTTTGRLEEGGTDAMACAFEIRYNAGDAANEDAREIAEQAAKDLAFVFIQEMNRIAEDEAGGGPLPGFDMDSVTYVITGPTGKSDYGCLVRFRLKDEAFDHFRYDPSDHFETEI